MLRVAKRFDCEINSVLVNRYKDGSCCIPWHSDDEPALGECPTIYSLSLGDARIFEIKGKTSRIVKKINLYDGTMVVM